MPRSPISSSARPSIDFRVPVLSRTTRCYGPTGRGTRMSSTSTRTSFFFSSDPVHARNHESNTTVHRLNVSVLLYFFNYDLATALVLPSCPTAPDLWPRLNYLRRIFENVSFSPPPCFDRYLQSSFPYTNSRRTIFSLFTLSRRFSKG